MYLPASLCITRVSFAKSVMSQVYVSVLNNSPLRYIVTVGLLYVIQQCVHLSKGSAFE